MAARAARLLDDELSFNEWLHELRDGRLREARVAGQIRAAHARQRRNDQRQLAVDFVFVELKLPVNAISCDGLG
ncbi:hypothetical protein [Burkholderia territorii]|uniref:hypothetical protein n=1 Tax=Burkholderia territorii TaxID=1503055 RepID=UPI0012D894B0|nr:hypothetical protein [Burkholderia territorii]